MSSMFEGAMKFNQPLGAWDISGVSSLSSMFMNAFAFNQDLSLWNTESVKSVRKMFCGAISFNNGSANHGFSEWKLPLITNESKTRYFLEGAISFKFDATEVPEICRTEYLLTKSRAQNNNDAAEK